MVTRVVLKKKYIIVVYASTDMSILLSFSSWHTWAVTITYFNIGPDKAPVFYVLKWQKL